jgi:hypothetical protein
MSRNRRRWLWISLIAFCTGILLWFTQRDPGRVEVRFERWESGFAVVSVYNGTANTVNVSKAERMGFWADVDWFGGRRRVSFTGKASLDVKSGEKKELGFREDVSKIQFFLGLWSMQQANEARTRYASYPQVIREWFLRRYTRVKLYTVDAPNPPPAKS